MYVDEPQCGKADEDAKAVRDEALQQHTEIYTREGGELGKAGGKEEEPLSFCGSYNRRGCYWHEQKKHGSLWIVLTSWLRPASVYLGLGLELIQRQTLAAFSMQANMS